MRNGPAPPPIRSAYTIARHRWNSLGLLSTCIAAAGCVEYASAVGADGKIYITGRDGTTVVIPNTGELDILATNTVGEPVDASPAIAGNQIFVRGDQHLFCIEE